MREYNNQDVKSNEAELDPCIAAEIRMKKALFSSKIQRSFFILIVVIASLILLSVLLVFLLSKTPKRTVTEPLIEVRETGSDDYASSLSSTPQINFISFETTEADSIIGTDDKPQQPKSLEIQNDPFLGIGDSSTEGKISSTVAQRSQSSAVDVITSTEIVETSPYFLQNTNMDSHSNVHITTTTTTSINSELISSIEMKEKDCKSLLMEGKTENGIYQIWLPKIGIFNVLCDMKTDGGGWTVIQKRQDESVYFANRTWKEYEDGFGRLETSFWLGLAKIQALTDGRPVTLRIELRGDLCEDKSGCSKKPDGYWWGEWDFKIGDAAQKYTLSISPAVAGNLSERTTTDRFHYMNNGKPFTTIDRDNDKFQGNCAQFRDFGGWWHNDCGYVALNGRYGDRTSKMRNMFWFYGSGTRPFVNYYIKPRESEMKIRPKS